MYEVGEDIAGFFEHFGGWWGKEEVGEGRGELYIC